MFCDALIFIGVAGEIKFGNLAKSIGDLRIAEFNTRTEEAQLKSLSLELRLAELLAPRNLTEQQMALMVETLKKFEGTPFDLSLSYSPEGARLLQQILSTLKAAGWSPKDRESGLIIRFPDTPIVGQIVSENIIIKVSPQKLKDWEQPTLAPANALIAAGMKVEAVEGYEPEDDDNAIHIRIGVKT